MQGSVLKSYLYGIKKSVPVFFGFLPVAITFAILAGSVGLNGLEATTMSVLVYAGASQIMAVQMIGAGAGSLSIILATFVLNLRHLIMGTCVFRKIKIKNFLLKLIGALAITDEGFAIITTEEDSKCNVPYMLGVITLTYLSWIFGTVIGAVASNILPQIVADSFGIALYALFLALIVPDVKKSVRLLGVVCFTALVNSALVLVLKLEGSWAIIISTLLGAAVGTLIVEDGEEKE